MNFVERILSYGFVRYVSEAEKKKGRYDVNFNTKNGWMGVVIYHPIEVFTKDDIEVMLSLEMFNTYKIVIHKDNTIEKIPVSEKEIMVKKAGKILYHTKNGIMPPKEIEEILK